MQAQGQHHQHWLLTQSTLYTAQKTEPRARSMLCKPTTAALQCCSLESCRSRAGVQPKALVVLSRFAAKEQRWQPLLHFRDEAESQ